MHKKLHAGTSIMIITMFHYISDHEFFLVLLTDYLNNCVNKINDIRINMSRIE